MIRPSVPDDGPDREDLPRALRRRTDVAYDDREPPYDPSDRETPRAAHVLRMSHVPPAAINQPVGLRVRSCSEDPMWYTRLIADIDGPTTFLARRPGAH
eukprot:8696822-Alexandrium_andersonii.AAC.1